MGTVILIHGAFGKPTDHWLEWLTKELEKEGHTIIAPQFPTLHHGGLEEWMKCFREWSGSAFANSVVVGHSLGAPFLLRLLQERKENILAAFFVAGFCSRLELPKFDPVIESFVKPPFDWKTIKKHCPKFVVFCSDDDPYVSMEKAEELAANLGVKVTHIKGAGHFNTKSGYTTFPRLLARIQEVLHG